MSDDLYQYMLKLMPTSRELFEVSEYTKSVPAGHMQSSPEQIKLFALLLKLLGAKRVIEIGVFTGYSALGIAQALPEDGLLYAFERDEAILEVAKSFWEKAGVSHKIKAIHGDAAKELQKMLDGDDRDAFDFAFIDANKRAQPLYFEQCLKLVRPGGLIVVDNVLWYGRVVDKERTDKITMSIRDLNQFLSEDPRIELTIIPVGDGIALCYVL